MIDTTGLILLFAVAYIIVLTALDKYDVSFPQWDFGRVLILYRTQKGLQLVEKLANKYTTFWEKLGTTGFIGGTVILIMGSVLVIFSGISAILNPPQQQITSPANYLVIPGVNDYLPLSVGLEIVIGLFLGMIVHEGGHAILSRVGDIEIKSAGIVFLAILPIGAFVEPDEESQDKATKMARLRMFAAGITNNIILTAITVALLVGVGSTIINPVSGAAIGGVLDGSPLDTGGIESGDVITSINGHEVTSNSDYQKTLQSIPDSTVTMTTKDGGVHTVNRELMIEKTIKSKYTPESLYHPGNTITAINGVEVQTVPQAENALNNTKEITAKIDTGKKTVSIPLGSLATVQKDSVLVSKTDLSVGDDIVIVSVGETRTHSTAEAQKLINNAKDTVTVSYVIPQNESNDSNSYTVKTTTIESNNIGIVQYNGYSGLTFTDTGVSLYPIKEFYSLVDPFETGASAIYWVVIFFFAPFATFAGLQYNFYGFEDLAANFYTSSVGFDPIVFFALNVFFWTAWININLAFFNCLPTYMLDGGHMLKDSTSLIGDKLGFDSEKFSHYTTIGVKLIIALSLIAMMGAPMIL